MPKRLVAFVSTCFGAMHPGTLHRPAALQKKNLQNCQFPSSPDMVPKRTDTAVHCAARALRLLDSHAASNRHSSRTKLKLIAT